MIAWTRTGAYKGLGGVSKHNINAENGYSQSGSGVAAHERRCVKKNLHVRKAM